MSRRELLRWAGIVGSTSLLPVVDPERSYAAAARSPRAPVPMNAELVTLTETSAVVTWYTGTPLKTGDSLQPSPQDTELLLGTSPLRLRTVHHDSRRTPFHHVEVHGLEPGRTYYYQARSDGVPALPATNLTGSPLGTATTTLSGLRGVADVFAFTTPQPPAGRHLFTLALANDIHMGETVAGLATSVPGAGSVPDGVRQVAGEPPYSQVMCEAMVAESRQRGAHTLLVAGDLSSEAAPGDLERAMRYLERFGPYREDVFVARGNHDRSHSGTGYDSCSASRVVPGEHDCFSDVFAKDTTTWFSTHVHGLHVIGLDTYDKAGDGGDNGALSATQLDWFERELAADPDRPTLVLGHHPITLTSDVINLEPLRFDLDLVQSNQIQARYARTPGVFFHHAAHTHRNFRTSSTSAKHVVFQEVGATKEYPGGYTLLRVHEGGYAVNFYKTRSDLAREWSERTRGEYAGLFGSSRALGYGLSAFYQAGSVGDRNYVVRRDLSGLQRAAVSGGVARGGDSGGGSSPHPGHAGSGSSADEGDGGLADTGLGARGAAVTAAGAGVVGGAALAATVRARRRDATPPES